MVAKTAPKSSAKPEAEKRDAKAKLLNAAFHIIRAQGFSGTSVDDLCREAGVTKGAFFHHFKSKDDLAVAAANLWSESTSALFAAAPYHEPADPVDRLLAYVDFRKSLLAGALPDFTCLAGMMLQETYDTNPDIRGACNASIIGHAKTLEPDFAAAIKMHKVKGVTAASLALHTQAVIQGAFILSKGAGSAKETADSLDHLRRYIALLFGRPVKASP